MLLSIAIQHYLTAMVGVMAPGTIEFYSKRLPSLVAILGDPEVTSITLDQLRQYRAALASKQTRWGGDSLHQQTPGGLSPHYLHQFVRSTRTLFTWLEEEGIIQVSPARRLELPPLPRQYRRGITAADRDAMLAAARPNVRDYAILLFFADTAARLAQQQG